MNPLSELKDIALPEQIHSYPVALGWWLLAIIVLALSIYIFVKFRQYKKQRVQNILAIHQLQSEQLTNEDVISVLKWASLQYFPRTEVAALFGTDFKTFLRKTLPDNQQVTFDQLSAKSFDTLYSKTNNHLDQQLKDAALHWLTYALPPKATTALGVQHD